MARILPHERVQHMLNTHSNGLSAENEQLREQLTASGDKDKLISELTEDVESLKRLVLEQVEQLAVSEIRISELNQVNMSLISQLDTIEKADTTSASEAKPDKKSKKS